MWREIPTPLEPLGRIGSTLRMFFGRETLKKKKKSPAKIGQPNYILALGRGAGPLGLFKPCSQRAPTHHVGTGGSSCPPQKWPMEKREQTPAKPGRIQTLERDCFCLHCMENTSPRLVRETAQLQPGWRLPR